MSVQSVSFNQARNGAITEDGTVAYEEPLEDGSYAVLHWDGIEMAERDMVLTDGKTDLAPGVFSLQSLQFTSDHYKVTSVGFDEDGNVDVSAVVFPLSGNQSVIAANFSDTNFIIED
jgi:hypothetical protein